MRPLTLNKLCKYLCHKRSIDPSVRGTASDCSVKIEPLVLKISICGFLFGRSCQLVRHHRCSLVSEGQACYGDVISQLYISYVK